MTFTVHIGDNAHEAHDLDEVARIIAEARRNEQVSVVVSDFPEVGMERAVPVGMSNEELGKFLRAQR